LSFGSIFFFDVAVGDEVHHALAYLRAEEMHAARDRQYAAFAARVQVAEDAQRGEREVEAGDEPLVDVAMENSAQDADLIAEKGLVAHQLVAVCRRECFREITC